MELSQTYTSEVSLGFIDLANAPYLAGLLVLAAILFLFDDVYLWSRQFRCYSIKEIPEECKEIAEPDIIELARKYARDNSLFNFFRACYTFAEQAFFLVIGWLPFLWGCASFVLVQVGLGPEYELLHAAIFLVMMKAVDTLLALPWVAWSTFVIEESFGFNNQTWSYFLKDNLKSFLFSTTFTVVAYTGLLFVMKLAGENFAFYGWLFIFASGLFTYAIYMDFIAPLFDTFTDLPDGKLKSSIESLASLVKFPLSKLYVVEGSRRSSHSNAYYFGFMKNKRIVISDSFLEEDSDDALNTDEVTAVVAHELGHWSHNHILKNFALQQMQTLGMICIFAHLVDDNHLYEDFGFRNERPMLIGLMICLTYVLSPLNTIWDFMMTKVSRYFEFQADNYAKSLGKSKELRSALLKLNKNSLGFPIKDPLYASFHSTHPTLVERIRNLKEKSE